MSSLYSKKKPKDIVDDPDAEYEQMSLVDEEDDNLE